MAWTQVSSLPDEEREQHRFNYGGYNDFPRNWREVDEAEMAQSHFFTYTPALVESRQMIHQTTVDETGRRVRVNDGIPEHRKGFVGAQLFFMYDGSGYGLVHEYWEKKVRWFRFDGPCDHEMETVRASKCYRESKCKHCDFRSAIDSSD